MTDMDEDIPEIDLLEKALTIGSPDPDALKQWLAIGFDVNHPLLTTRPPSIGSLLNGDALLMRAIGDSSEPHVEMMRMLMDAGAKADFAFREDGVTPLMHCISEHGRAVGDLRIPQMILDSGANVNAQDRGRSAAIHFAARRGDVAMMSLLADRGADLLLKTSEQETALHKALDHAQACQWLLDRHPELVDMRSRSGDTALLLAVGSDRFPAVQTLMAAGADPRVRSNYQKMDAYALGEFLERKEMIAWMAHFEVAKAARTAIDDVLRHQASQTTGPGGPT